MPPSVNLDLDFLNFVWSVRNHLPHNSPTDLLAASFLVCVLDMHTSQTVMLLIAVLIVSLTTILARHCSIIQVTLTLILSMTLTLTSVGTLLYYLDGLPTNMELYHRHFILYCLYNSSTCLSDSSFM